MAYVDNYLQQFHLFYYGDTAMVETFPPDSFKVGFANMAYVDQLGNFRVFENGSTFKILSDRPDFLRLKETLLFTVIIITSTFIMMENLPSCKAGHPRIFR